MNPTPRGHHLGYVPDAPDHRDHRLTLDGLAPAAFVDLQPDPAMPPVWDQGQLGSCTAHGSLAGFLYAAAKAGHALPMLSRLEVYYNARALEGTTAQDAGAQIRDAIKACAAGVAPETDWPYTISRYAVKPSTKTVTDSTHKAIEYLSVGRTANALQACLTAGFPVVIGTTLYSSFEASAAIDTGVVPYPKTAEQVLGGHCMAVVGIGTGDQWSNQYPAAATYPTRSYVKIRNSWGTSVYRDGYLLLPTAYLSQHGQDFWSIHTAN